MPLSPELARWLAQQGHDAVHALEAGLDRASDEVILERARKEQRVVLTADLDYPRLLALAQAEGPGLILFRGGNYSGTRNRGASDSSPRYSPERGVAQFRRGH